MYALDRIKNCAFLNEILVGLAFCWLKRDFLLHAKCKLVQTVNLNSNVKILIVHCKAILEMRIDFLMSCLELIIIFFCFLLIYI